MHLLFKSDCKCMYDLTMFCNVTNSVLNKCCSFIKEFQGEMCHGFYKNIKQQKLSTKSVDRYR